MWASDTWAGSGLWYLSLGWHDPVMIRAEPLSLEWAEALAEGEEVFSESFGIPVADGWAVFPEALPGALRATSEDGDPWGTHLFFDDDALVGWGGWKGPPVNGVVEFGYAVARQGGAGA